MRSMPTPCFATMCICRCNRDRLRCSRACSGSIHEMSTCAGSSGLRTPSATSRLRPISSLVFPARRKQIFKYSKRPNTPALQYEDQIPEEEKTRRLMILQERQRAIQLRRNAQYIGKTEEVLVEGYNRATGQWIGRTAQNKTLNFHDPSLPAPTDGRTHVGKYMDVLITRAGPNSLAGEKRVPS